MERFTLPDTGETGGMTEQFRNLRRYNQCPMLEVCIIYREGEHFSLSIYNILLLEVLQEQKPDTDIYKIHFKQFDRLHRHCSGRVKV